MAEHRSPVSSASSHRRRQPYSLDTHPNRAHHGGMTDEKKPDPLEDLQKGIGLLFRAARSAVDQLPTKGVEEVVKTGVREVGRALGNVTERIAENVRPGKKPDSTPPPAPKAPTEEKKPEEPGV